MTRRGRILLLGLLLLVLFCVPALGAKWLEMTLSENVKEDLNALKTFCLLHNLTPEDVLWANSCKEEDLVPGKVLYLPRNQAELLSIWQHQGAWKPKALVPKTSAAAARRAQAKAPAPASKPEAPPDPELTSEPAPGKPKKVSKSFLSSLFPFLGSRKRDSTPSIQSGKMLWPVDGAVSSPFGRRGRRHHDGIDIPMPVGTPIRVARDGVVTATGNNSPGFRGYGKFVLVDHGGGIKTLYGHCLKVSVRVGQRLRQGQVIAQVGRTGRASTNHLHFEVRVKDKPVNPIPYLQPRRAAAQIRKR